jgi:hypothetical protein
MSDAQAAADVRAAVLGATAVASTTVQSHGDTDFESVGSYLLCTEPEGRGNARNTSTHAMSRWPRVYVLRSRLRLRMYRRLPSRQASRTETRKENHG